MNHRQRVMVHTLDRMREEALESARLRHPSRHVQVKTSRPYDWETEPGIATNSQGEYLFDVELWAPDHSDVPHLDDGFYEIVSEDGYDWYEIPYEDELPDWFKAMGVLLLPIAAWLLAVLVVVQAMEWVTR